MVPPARSSQRLFLLVQLNTATEAPATAAGTSMTTYLCGDLLAQEVGGEPFDGVRTLRMITVGTIASVPGYKW